MRHRPGVVTVCAAVVATAGAVFAMTAPPDRLQGDLQRLMYVHVPAAWLAYVSFLVTLYGSIAWLVRRRPADDRLAASAAEIGVFFTGLTIVLGAVWGKPVWGVWWTWDPRLVTTAVLFFVYLGYLALRRASPDRESRARRSAIYGIIASVQLPVIHFSVLWWRSLHQPPTILRPGDPTIDHTMLAAVIVNLAAFSLIGLVLLRTRLRLALLEDAIDDDPPGTDRHLAGESVEAPRLPEGGTRV